MNSTSTAQPRIPSLDGLRAVSIIIVMLAHLSGTVHFPWPIYTRYFYGFGAFGVKIFFVISGFLITTLLSGEESRLGRISIRHFYIRRSFRIWPVAYIFIAVVGLLSIVRLIELPRYNLLFAATFTMNHVVNGTWWTGHLWSLAVEEQFYLIWPAVFLICGHRGRVLSCLSVMMLAPVLKGATYVFAPNVYEYMQASLPFVGDSIALGCLLALLRPRLQGNSTFKAVVASRYCLAAPVLAVVLYGSAVGHLWRNAFPIADSISLLCIGVTLWRVVHRQDGFFRVLNTRTAVFVGRMSYSLYIWQQLFLNKHSTAWINRFPENLVLAGAVAAISYRWIELPGLRLRDVLQRRVSRSEMPPRVGDVGMVQVPSNAPSADSHVGSSRPVVLEA